MAGESRVSGAVATFLSGLRYEEDDPRAAMCSLAVLLAEEMDRKPSAALARELRHVLADVSVDTFPNQPPGDLDALRLRRYQRRLNVVTGAIAQHEREEENNGT